MYLVRRVEESEKFETLMQRIEDYDFNRREMRYTILRDSPRLVLDLLEEKGDNIECWHMTEKYKHSLEEKYKDRSGEMDIDKETFEYFATDRIISATAYYDGTEVEGGYLEVTFTIANEESIMIEIEDNSIKGFEKTYFSIDGLKECDFSDYLYMSWCMEYGEPVRP